MKTEPAPDSLCSVSVPAEQFGQPARQRQAETGAAHAPLQPVLDLPELFEDPRLILGRDPDAGVGDAEDDHAGRRRRTGPRRAPRRVR